MYCRTLIFCSKQPSKCRKCISETHISKEFRRGMPLAPLQTCRHKKVTSLLTDIKKLLDPPLKLQDFQSTKKIQRGFFQLLIYVNIKLQPDTCSGVLRCGGSPFYFHTYLYSFFTIGNFRSYTDFNNKISNKNHIASIYPSKLYIYTLFTLGSD